MEILEVGDCAGEIEHEGASLPVTFRIDSSSSSEIAVKINPLPVTETTVQFTERLYNSEKHDRRVPSFTIKGRTSDNRQVICRHTFVTQQGYSINNEQSVITMTCGFGELEVGFVSDGAPSPGTPTSALAEYYVKGQRGFALQSSESDIGTVSIAAESGGDVVGADRYTGFVRVEQEMLEESNVGEWLDNCDNLAYRVIQVLSLAQGAYLSWGMCKVFLGKVLWSVRARPRGAAQAVRVAVFPYLNLHPVLELAVRKYSPNLAARTGFDVALSWFLSPVGLPESRYLQMFVALEHLVHVYSGSEPRSVVVRREIFRDAVRPALGAALEALARDSSADGLLTEAQVSELLGRLGDINRRSFRERLEAMLDSYRVYYEDIRVWLPRLIDLRNNIVHQGLFGDLAVGNDEIIRCENVAEELLVRVFLALLEFQGRYHSPLQNLEYIAFPRVEDMGARLGTSVEPAASSD